MQPKLDEFRERSPSVWDAMAPGWETGRQDLWEFSRPVSEWLIERRHSQAGLTPGPSVSAMPRTAPPERAPAGW